MRLIDADELKNTIQWSENVRLSITEISKIIDNAPTVEAKTTADCIIAYGDGYETARRLYERPQGEWIKLRDYDFKCSLCGYSLMDKYNFCPECGAIMKGVKNENL